MLNMPQDRLMELLFWYIRRDYTEIEMQKDLKENYGIELCNESLKNRIKAAKKNIK